MAAPAKTLRLPGERREERLAISVVSKDSPARVTARGDVVERTGEFNAERTGHAQVYQRNIILQDATPFLPTQAAVTNALSGVTY